MELLSCLFCRCHCMSLNFMVLCICGFAWLITLTIVVFLYKKNEMVHIRKLRAEEEIKAMEFTRKKEWESFLRDMEKEKEESIAKKRDEAIINANKESAISYAKSIILLSDLLRSDKPLSASKIENGRKNVDSFLEMLKSLSDNDTLNELLNKK